MALQCSCTKASFHRRVIYSLVFLAGFFVILSQQLFNTRLNDKTSLRQLLASSSLLDSGAGETDASPIGSSSTSSVCDGQRQCIPRNLHLIWYHEQPIALRFHQLISFLAALRFFQPRTIYFWHDTVPTGSYWIHFVNSLPASCRLRMIQRKRPTKIFGHPINVIEHQSDILRMEVLMSVGGLYIDTDLVLLHPIDDLLQYETVMGAENTYYLCNGFIAAAPNARFLRLWYDDHRDFDDMQWSRHSVLRPWWLYRDHPDLIHVEFQTINRPNCGTERKYLVEDGLYYNLSRNYAVHLWYRHYNIDHTPFDINTLNNTIGRIFRYIFHGLPDIE